jgi:A/G-specific adenine glycosylase
VKGEAKEAFRKLIWDFYGKQGRSFPWRNCRDPWLILISEMMLQQTQTSRVEAKWSVFAEAFPAPAVMAGASLSEVLRLWSGLGYNRRALALKSIADRVAAGDGRLPDSYDGLISLPMIGPYTAKAVLAFAYNRPVVCIETNIRRVFLHHFFPGETGVSDSGILPLIEETLERENPREWYYALMDYGAALPRQVTNPNRRSAHYSRQAPFQGSNRQKRGALLRELTRRSGEALSASSLAPAAQIDADTAKGILDSLVREGFACESGGCYSIRR